MVFNHVPGITRGNDTLPIIPRATGPLDAAALQVPLRPATGLPGEIKHCLADPFAVFDREGCLVGRAMLKVNDPGSPLICFTIVIVGILEFTYVQVTSPPGARWMLEVEPETDAMVPGPADADVLQTSSQPGSTFQ